MNKNVFGEPIITCSKKPMTGFFRNGCCDTDESDHGLHTVCVIVDDNFLNFSNSFKTVGSDSFSFLAGITNVRLSIKILNY